MKFLTALFLLLSTSALAVTGSGNVSNVLQFSGGGGSSSALVPALSTSINVPLADLRIIHCGNSTAPNYTMAWSYDGGTDTPNSQYQVDGVAGTRKLYVYQVGVADVAVGNPAQFGYGTAPLIAEQTATAPTGSTPYGGSTVAFSGYQAMSTSAYTNISTWMVFPSQAYIWCRFNGNGTRAILYGYLK